MMRDRWRERTAASCDSPASSWHGCRSRLDRDVLADEGGEGFDDRGLVRWAVVHQAFQGLDAPDSHIELLVAKLFDRLGVAIGQLALSGEPIGVLAEPLVLLAQ